MTAMFCIVLSPMLIAQTVMDDSSVAHPVKAGAAISPGPGPDLQAVQITGSQLDQEVGALADPPQQSKSNVTQKPGRHHLHHGRPKQGSHRIARAIGFVAFLPLEILYLLPWMIVAITGGCKDGC